MALKIRYLTGDYAGREIDIDDDVELVRFGRGLDAEIPFPEEMTLVSHQHFGLRKEYGGYKFSINREKPVFMDGRPVFDDQDLPKRAEIQISGPTGPRLSVERVQVYGANQLRTEVLKTGPDLAGTLHATRASGRRTTATLAIVALALIVAAGAGWWLLKGTQEQVAATGEAVATTQADIAATKADLAAIKEQIPGIKEQMDAIGKSYDFSALIEETKGSVYQVAVQTPSGQLIAGGTAWVVQLKDGTKALATNAHVAELFDLAKTPDWGEGVLVAIEPQGPEFERFLITGYTKHPAYDEWIAFNDRFWNEIQAGTVARIMLPIGYDVALMTVENPDRLGTPLPLASTEKLQAMRAGQRLLQIGYPSENVLGTDVAQPEPNSQGGVITAMTSFFLSAGDPAERQFIQHNAAGAGGSSGSAMLNTEGEVIGLHNSGNYIFLQIDGRNERVPSAGNINYGQRADLLAELIDGTAKARLDNVYRPMWQAAEKRFSKSAEQVLKDQITNLGYEVGGADKVTEFATLEGIMEAPDASLDGMRAVSFNLDPPVGHAYLFLASSEDQRNIGLAIFQQDGDFFAAGNRGSFFSSFIVRYDVSMPVRIAVFDDFYDKDGAVNPKAPGKVKLQVFSAPMPTN